MTAQAEINKSFRILAQIGTGSSGAVYKAWHTRLGKHVIVKECSLTKSRSVRRNELEALKNVKSQYLPQVYDYAKESDRVFSVTEYVEGKSFDELLVSNLHFSQDDVIKWYCQLASALGTLHASSICHRDIKPANIVLKPEGDVCLIDFGSALVNGSPAWFASRSLGYASPEQLEYFERIRSVARLRGQGGRSQLPTLLITPLESKGVISNPKEGNGASGKEALARPVPGVLVDEPDYNKTEFTPTSDSCPLPTVSLGSIRAIDWVRSDIYSLGATMYHILSGKRPCDRAEDIVPISQLGSFGPGLTSIIEKSMQPDPSMRFASMVELTNSVYCINDQ